MVLGQQCCNGSCWIERGIEGKLTSIWSVLSSSWLCNRWRISMRRTFQESQIQHITSDEIELVSCCRIDMVVSKCVCIRCIRWPVSAIDGHFFEMQTIYVFVSYEALISIQCSQWFQLSTSFLMVILVCGAQCGWFFCCSLIASQKSLLPHMFNLCQHHTNSPHQFRIQWILLYMNTFGCHQCSWCHLLSSIYHKIIFYFISLSSAVLHMLSLPRMNTNCHRLI